MQFSEERLSKSTAEAEKLRSDAARAGMATSRRISGRTPIKAALLATYETIIHYGKLHSFSNRLPHFPRP
jgi:hypothetical protein